MRLQGVEFFNYACFERQFVPIKQGINLLVGKNNAGKTALLKGIAALTVVPLENWPRWRNISPETRTFVQNLTAYLPDRGELGPGEQRGYDVHVHFELDQGDPLPIAGDATNWNPLIADGASVAYIFSFMPNQTEDQVVFKSAQLRIRGQILEFITANEQGVFYRGFQQDGGTFKEGNGRNLSTGGRTISGPDRKNYLVPVPTSDWFKPMSPFLGARYVAAHRVVAPWIDIHTAESLPDSADNLSVFLQTLHGNKPKEFRQIEAEVQNIFPELLSINPATEANRVQLALSLRGKEQAVPLTHSGTGVEQVLAILAFAITAPRGTVLLVDEPHSFLHPTAERQLVRFLESDNQHPYVIGTHSAVFINSVGAERITYVESPGSASNDRNQLHEVSEILQELGYKNSDILFHDVLLIVEGKSDRAVLPILLEKAGVDRKVLAGVGFPMLEGAPEKLNQLQSSVIKYEKLIAALSKTQLPRMYILDGDRSGNDKNAIQAMRNAEGTEALPVQFLPRTELENYLLVPEAVRAALFQEAKLAGITLQGSTVENISGLMNELLKSEDKDLFPNGKSSDPKMSVKGSRLLERLYGSVDNLVYNKEHSGALIAKNITSANQPALSELRKLVEKVFANR